MAGFRGHELEQFGAGEKTGRSQKFRRSFRTSNRNMGGCDTVMLIVMVMLTLGCDRAKPTWAERVSSSPSLGVTLGRIGVKWRSD